MVVELPLVNNDQTSIISNGIKCCKQYNYDCWLSSKPITEADSLAVIAAYDNGNSGVMARKVPAGTYYYIGYATTVGYGSLQVYNYQYANGIMYGDFPSPPSINSFDSSVFEGFYDSRESAISAVINYLNPIAYPINYRLTNCTAPLAPIEALVGETVNVPFSFSDGYGFINPSTDVYVMNNGVLVPSTYSNGILSFTMPDPS